EGPSLFLQYPLMDNVFSLLRQDFVRLRAFTWNLCRPYPEGAAASSDARDLARQWAIHFQSEESFRFPRLAEDAEMRPLLRHLSETHALVREDVRELIAAEDSADAASKAEALRHALSKAVELEDKSLFRRAEKIIPPEEAEDMAREVQDFRDEIRHALHAAA